MGRGFVPVARRPPPAVATADVTVEAPPELSSPPSSGPLRGLFTVVMPVASIGLMAAMYLSGSAHARGPMFIAFPAMMLISTAATVLAGRARRPGRDVDAIRGEYFGYLRGLRETVADTAVAQRSSLLWCHPDPDTLWTLIGGPRMWERRPADPDFCLVRVGVGAQPLATRLVAPQTPAGRPSDPVTAAALRRFLRTHSAVVAPIAIGLRGTALVTIDGDAAAARGLLRAVICQLAVLHPPDQLLVVGAISDRNRPHWEWLKWLPHNQHPTAVDALGSVRMVYRNPVAAQHALADLVLPPVVMVADLDEGAAEIARVTTLASRNRPPRRAVDDQARRPGPAARVSRSAGAAGCAGVCPAARRVPRRRARCGKRRRGVAGLGRTGRCARVRPDRPVGQPRPPRSTAHPDRHHRRGRAADAGYQGGRRKRYGPARSLRGRHRVGQVGAVADYRPGHDGAQLPRSAQPAAHRLQRWRNVSRLCGRAARGGGHHQPRGRSPPGRPDARRPGRRDEPAPTAAADRRPRQHRGLPACAPARRPDGRRRPPSS